jgi:hypothetical protein
VFSSVRKVYMLHRKLILTAIAGFALAVSGYAGPIYSFSSFDGPGNNAGGTTVNGINNNGQVVGFSSDNAANPTQFTNFVRNADGTFNLLSIGGDPLAMANGINDAQTVVGGASNGTAFTLSGGPPLTLPMVTSTTISETAFGLNNGGLIVGQYTDGATDTTPGYVYNGPSFTILNPTVTATVTNAQGVNSSGLVIGFYSADGVHQHGFLYNSATSSYSLLSDPNVPNLVLTQFLGLNDIGLAVGYYQLPNGSQHGFLYNIATQTYTFLDDPSAATSGVSITQITGINNSNELTGFYLDSTTSSQRGFVAMLTPEPGTFALAMVSLGAILLRQGRRFHS